MIISNGTIEAKTKRGGGIDPVTGHPLKPDGGAWGEPIACQYVPQHYDALALTAGGEPYTAAKYAVYIEACPFEAEQIRLRDAGGRIVGDFSVIWNEPLDAVGERRLWI